MEFSKRILWQSDFFVLPKNIRQQFLLNLIFFSMWRIIVRKYYQRRDLEVDLVLAALKSVTETRLIWSFINEIEKNYHNYWQSNIDLSDEILHANLNLRLLL